MHATASWSRSAALGAALCLAPSIAWADPLPEPAFLAEWALPMFTADAIFMLGTAFALAAVGWSRLGLLLWIVAVSAGGYLFVYTMPHALKPPSWHLPAFVGGFLLFVCVAELSRKRLSER